MLDVLFVVITILFFTLATAYVYGCERLRPRHRDLQGREQEGL